MNSLVDDEFPGTHNLRDQLLDMITDQDLAYKLPGSNPTLGELCEEMGHVEQVYIRSFKTFKQDWGYRVSEVEATTSVASLAAWYKRLDAELVEALSGLSEDDVQNKQIDRGHGFTPSPYVQFLIYHEAVLIFCAKASAYLKALEKPYPDEWKVGIG
jgi:DinB superfamily